MNAVDTNIFAYAFDAKEPVKQTKAQRLLVHLAEQPNKTVLLWQVAGEFLNCLRRWESAGYLSASDVERHFSDTLGLFDLQIPTVKLFPIAFDLHSRFSLSHWDSMLLAACKEARIDTLYSEDMDAGTDYDGLSIINPFV